jgi:hypothetical protein
VKITYEIEGILGISQTFGLQGRLGLAALCPMKSTKKILKLRKKKIVISQTEEIDVHKIATKKSTRECLRCAWPSEKERLP